MLSLMLAPHSLTLMGNLAGTHQWMFLIFICLAAGLYWLNGQSLRALAALPHDVAVQPLSLRFLLLSSRWTTAVTLPTVLLVTAGFTFNETFIHWFPNFAFAFILLGLVLAIQLMGEGIARRFQIGFMLPVVLGLMTLGIMGVWQLPSSTLIMTPEKTGFQIYAFCAILLLLVGFDLSANNNPLKNSAPKGTIAAGLATIIFIFILWATASLVHIPADRLSDSYIPYVLAARSIGGETGRYIMGAIIIAGSCAATNAIFLSQSQITAHMASHWPTNNPEKSNLLTRPYLWSILSTVAVGVMMASGMAGTDEIDIYIRAGLIIWLIYYGSIHLVLLIAYLRVTGPISWHRWIVPSVGVPLMSTGIIVLLLLDPDRAILLKSLSIVVFIVLFTVLMAYFVNRAFFSERKSKVKRPF